MEKVMLKSTELADPLCNGTIFTFKYRIEIEGDRIRGLAFVEGMDYLTVKMDELIVKSEIRETKDMKYWLEANLSNLVVEFDEAMSKNG